MKIGIITFWQTKDNYGQMLQAFALQRKLELLGHNPFLIRYTHSQYRPYQSIKDYILTVLRCIKHLRLPEKRYYPWMFTVTENDKKRKFEEFKKKYLNLSWRKYRNLKTLQKCCPKADAYIVGSDQVWVKTLYTEENEVFFLNFGSKSSRRISYAASFANSTYPEELKAKLYNSLSRLNAVSVREISGVKICEDVGINAELVLDPTLLLDYNDYKRFFNIKRLWPNGIFVYCLNIKDKEDINWSSILQYATQTNQSIKVTPSSGYLPASELFGNDVNYVYSTIPEWINNIQNSQLVVTPSFHGIVFSIITHTPFIYVPLKGENAKGNNRTIDLLNKLGIPGHIMERGYSIEQLAHEKIDWKSVDCKLDNLRKTSIAFLKNNLC